MIKNRIRNNIKKYSAAALLGTIVFSSIFGVTASVIDNAQSAIDNANANLNQTNSQISEIEKQQADLQAQINSLDAELVGVLLDIDILKDEITLKEEEIEQTTQDLADAEAEKERQYESMKLRIRFMYENSGNNIVEALLGASSLSDFLNRVEYFNKIYQYDRDMLEEYKDTIQQVSDHKATLEQEKIDMLQLKENYEHQSKELDDVLAAKRSTMSDFDTKLTSAKNLAAQYKDTIRKQNEIIRNEEARLAAEAERKRQEELARQEAERLRKEEERRRQEEEERRRQEEQNNSSDNNTTDNTTPSTPTDTTDNTSTDTGKDPAYTTNISGQDVVDFAKQYVGNKYVWGGESLTDGCDCSGFVMKVYEHFGITLPHSSYSQRSCGSSVSYSNAKPGDIVCYSGHVAIYIGDGQIVGAQSTATGIAIVRATYRTILDVRRVL